MLLQKFTEIFVKIKSRKIKYINLIFLFLIFLFLFLAMPKIWAQTAPVEMIEFFSEKQDYNKKENGAWRVRKSAKWINKNKVRMNVDIDTVAEQRNNNMDVIVVADISSAMTGFKLEKVKSDLLEFADDFLVNKNNTISLISFADSAELVTAFDSDINSVTTSINSLRYVGRSNYYKAFVKVGALLKNYKKEKNRDCMVLFLTGSYPSIETPNEEGYFNYLKDTYPYLGINAVQYGMGDSIQSFLKNISDKQYLVLESTQDNILFEAFKDSELYTNFEYIDFFNSNYFYLDSVDDVNVTQGEIAYSDTNHRINWKISNLKSGMKVKMTIDLTLNSEYFNKIDLYSTNSKQQVLSEIKQISENVENNESLIMLNGAKINYDLNEPAGCNILDKSDEETYFVSEEVTLSDKKPICDGYLFKGWKILESGVKQIDKEHFIMPSKDVNLRAQWSKISINKKMQGEVYTAPVGVLQVADKTGTQKFWKYKESIKNVVFQNNLEPVLNASESWDVSEAQNKTVMAYLVPNTEDTEKYTLYIQADNGISANKNSSYLFNEFIALESIDGLNYLDTTNTEDMSFMFGWDSALTSVDVSMFDTSKVTTMQNMFRDMGALKTLDVSGFDTSKVTDMRWMFGGTGSLKELDVSNFDTSNVTDMYAMFAGIGVTTLDLSNFDTSNVTTMYAMFSSTNNLVNLKIDSFNTSKVTNMQGLFSGCLNIKTIDLSNFDTSKVTTMRLMFNSCKALTSLNLTNLKTENVIDMSAMFGNCTSLRELDVSSFNTENVTNMTDMFNSCYTLTSLTLSNFDTKNVTVMKGMFAYCKALKSLNLSTFNTAKVTDMSAMFSECKALTSLTVNKFNTTNVTNMSNMFGGCSVLKSLDVSNFNTAKVTNMSYMFYDCGLTSLNVSNFNTAIVTNMSHMFQSCWYITAITQNFNTANVTDFSFMFSGCQKLTTLSVANFRTPKATTMEAMFEDCTVITSMNFTNFDTRNVKNMDKMFENCWNIIGTITIRNPSTTYSEMLYETANSTSAKLVLNYTSATSSLVNSMIASKSSDAKVSKGSLVT